MDLSLYASAAGLLLWVRRAGDIDRQPLADLGFFRRGDFGNPSERSERALGGSGLTG